MQRWTFSVGRMLFALLILLPSLAWAEPDNLRRTPTVRVVEKAGPAVVNIFTEEAPRQFKNPFRNFFGDKFFERFFQGSPQRRGPKRRSLGSGVIIRPDGYILTNEHVIAKAVRISVTLIDNREFEAQLIGADASTDLAVIKIDSKKPLPFVSMGHSNDLMIGEPVVAIGNPFGLSHTVTRGIISALHRSLNENGKAKYHDFIQLDASINPGNSGGPLLNIEGSLIGINTAIIQGAAGIGFAIPIDNARRIIDELIEFGSVRRGWIGVSVQDLTPELKRYFKITQSGGVLITRVFPESPASQAGLRQGDILTAIGQHRITGKSDYFTYLRSFTVDDTVEMNYLRDGRAGKARVALAALTVSQVSRFARHWLGIQVQNIDRALAQRFRLGSMSGVVITHADPDGASGRIGIRPGDVIRRINKNKVNSLKDFNQAMVEAGRLNSILLLVQRGRSGYYVTLEP